MKRKILIPTILGVALAAGTGVASAQASPSAPVAKPAAAPNNTQATALPLGTIYCDGADVSFVVKGDNTKGTSAWYYFDVTDGGGLGCLLDSISLSGNTGDTLSLYHSYGSDPEFASDVRSVSDFSDISPSGTGIFVDVTGGTKGKQFTLTVIPANT